MDASPADAEQLEDLLRRLKPSLPRFATRLMRYRSLETMGQWDIPLPEQELHEDYFNQRGILLVSRHISVARDARLWPAGTMEPREVFLVLLEDGSLAEIERSGGSYSDGSELWQSTMRGVSAGEALSLYGLQACTDAIRRNVG